MLQGILFAINLIKTYMENTVIPTRSAPFSFVLMEMLCYFVAYRRVLFFFPFLFSPIYSWHFVMQTQRFHCCNLIWFCAAKKLSPDACKICHKLGSAVGRRVGRSAPLDPPACQQIRCIFYEATFTHTIHSFSLPFPFVSCICLGNISGKC